MIPVKKRGDKIIHINPEKCKIVYTDRGAEVYQDNKPLKLDAAFFYGVYFSEEQRYSMYSVLDALQANGVKLLDSPDALKVTDDKKKEAQLFAQNHIPIPKTIFYGKKAHVRDIPSPTILKEVLGYAGDQVYLLPNGKAVKKHDVLRAKGTHAVFQDYIQSSRGKSIRVVVVNGKPVGTVRFKTTLPDDFRSNADENHLTEPVQNLTKRKRYEKLAARAVKTIPGLNVAGVDILDGLNGPVVLEVNSSPDFLTTSDVLKNDIPDIIARSFHAPSGNLKSIKA